MQYGMPGNRIPNVALLVLHSQASVNCGPLAPHKRDGRMKNHALRQVLQQRCLENAGVRIESGFRPSRRRHADFSLNVGEGNSL